VVRGASAAKLEHQAWHVTASVVVTGQKASYEGVKVDDTFDVSAGRFGAIELVGRYDVLALDEDAVDTFGDPARHFTDATGLWLGANWFPNSAIKVSVAFVRTTLELPAAAPDTVEEPDPEQLVILQTQLQF
jgi:phosphate-selective porin OprO and OprP